MFILKLVVSGGGPMVELCRCVTKECAAYEVGLRQRRFDQWDQHEAIHANEAWLLLWEGCDIILTSLDTNEEWAFSGDNTWVTYEEYTS